MPEMEAHAGPRNGVEVFRLIHHREPSGSPLLEGSTLRHFEHAEWRLVFFEALPLPRTVAPIKEGLEITDTRATR
ncbi:hypothetical protein, partial [Proteus terrae]|uniref:hypothetical protein n=1 Tax=Proteus terrae TaxID=1574161 RepID=UPI00301E343B